MRIIICLLTVKPKEVDFSPEALTDDQVAKVRAHQGLQGFVSLPPGGPLPAVCPPAEIVATEKHIRLMSLL